MRFHSGPVIRVPGAKPLHLGHVDRADGAWRITIFADQHDPAGEESRARAGLCALMALRCALAFVIRFLRHFYELSTPTGDDAAAWALGTILEVGGMLGTLRLLEVRGSAGESLVLGRNIGDLTVARHGLGVRVLTRPEPPTAPQHRSRRRRHCERVRAFARSTSWEMGDFVRMHWSVTRLGWDCDQRRLQVS